MGLINMNVYAIQTSKGDYVAFSQYSDSSNEYQIQVTPGVMDCALYLNLTIASYALNGFNSLGFTDLIIVQVEID
jgi:hypothetical protein